MPEWFFNIIRSSYIWYILVVWLIICIIWKSKWRALLLELSTLIKKKTILVHDPTTNDPKSVQYFYPRGALEWLAQTSKNELCDIGYRITSLFDRWISGLLSIFQDNNKPIKTIFYVLLLPLFSTFIFTSLVFISSALGVNGYILGGMPPSLNHFEIVLLAGLILAPVIGFLVILEQISNKGGVVLDFENGRKNGKNLIIGLAILIVMLGLSVWFVLGFSFFNVFTINKSVFNLLSFYIITPLNTLLGAAILGRSAVKGTLVLIMILVSLCKLLFQILSLLVKILVMGFFIIMDVIWRLVFFLVRLVLHVIITPLDFFVFLVAWPFKK